MKYEVVLEQDGGVVYSDNEITVTPKRVVVNKEWVENPESGMYPIENIYNVNAMRSIPWSGVLILVLITLAMLYFGWILAALISAVISFLTWKYLRDGDLFLNLDHSRGGAVHIPSGYDRVLEQKAAIDSIRDQLSNL